MQVNNMRLINADEFEVIGGVVPDEHDTDSYLAGCMEILNKIDEAPTIDAEPVRHGRWEKASEYMPIYVCSECKERNLFKNGNNVFSNYCPNCGAKMDLEGEQ